MKSGQLSSRARRVIRPLATAVCLMAACMTYAADDCEQYSEMLDYGIIGEAGFTYGNNSEINDNAISGSNGNTPTPTGAITTVDPDFPPFEPASFPSGDSNRNDVTSLSSGTYGKVTVKQNSTLTLAPGTYFINELVIGNKVDVVIRPAGTVRLYIGKTLDAGNEVALNPDGSVANLMIFLYGGANFSAGNGNQGNSDLNFNGILYSPYSNTKISFGNNNDIQGAILSAGTIDVGNNTTFDYGKDIEQEVREALGCEKAPPLDHFRIEYYGPGLTCMAEKVTVRACADEACTDYTKPVTVQINTNLPSSSNAQPIWVGSNQTTTTTGEATFSLRSSTAGVVNLTLSSAPQADVPVRCNGVATSTCSINFETVGLLFDGDDADDNPQSPIPEQIAGKPSDTGYQTATQRLRVVRADEKTGACESVLKETMVPARFHYTVPVASTGLTDNRISISGASNALTAAGSVQSADLAFGTDGTAPFWFSSRDAGVHTLHVELPVSIDDDSDGNADRTLTLNTQRAFIARPLAVYVDTEPRSNPQAADASGGVFARAGDAFPLRFVALGWQDSADDSNDDGNWDACASPTLSEGQPRARVPEWEIGTPQASLFAPAGGAPGSLTYPDGTARFAAGSDTLTLDSGGNRVSFSEAGIIRFDGTNLPFLTTAAQACSPRIGRFTPASFEIENVITPGCGAFTYAGVAPLSKPGQAFTLSGKITAKNAGGNTTENYEGDFAKLAAEHVEFEARHHPDSTLSDSPVLDAATLSNPLGFVDGVLAFSLMPKLSTSSLLPEHLSYVVITLKEPEVGETSFDDPSTGEPFRHGRVVLGNGHSHLESGKVPLRARLQLYDGVEFKRDEGGIDTCTEVPETDVLIGAFNPDDTVTLEVSDDPPYVASFSSGELPFSIDPANKAGFAPVTLKVPDWMKYDWDGDKAHDDNPTGRATWGLYRGNPSVIRMREVWN